MKLHRRSVIPAALLLASGLSFPTSSFGQTQAAPSSDFTAAVQAGLQATAASPAAQAVQLKIKEEDNKSTWDEFGMTTLVDGAMPAVEVSQQITEDIVQSVESALKYDQQEAQYLSDSETTPEQIQAIEGSTDSDVPADESIDPNPSIDENPDASLFPDETLTQDDMDGDSSASSTSDITIPLPEIGTSTTDDMSVSSDTGTSSEDVIFNAILQGEESSPVDQPPVDSSSDGSTQTLPSDTTSPPDGTPPPEAPPPAQ